MSVSNTAVKALYQGNGSNDTFAIPCQYVAVEASTVIKVYAVDEDGIKTLLTEGAMQDYTLDPPYHAVTNPAGPANVIFNTPPDADTKVLVTRSMLLRQVLAFSSIGRIPGESVEQGLDRLCYLIQQLGDKLGRTLEFNILDDGVASFDMPKLTADTFIAVNDTGTGFVLKTATDIVSDGGAGLPVGGDIGDFLEKNSSTDSDASWQSANYEGISRFGAWSSAGLKDTIDKIIAITYTAPTISLSGSSNSLREKGDSVASIILTATVTKQSDPIAEVRFYEGASLIETDTGTIPAGGVETANYNTPFDDTISFTARVDDNGDTGGPTTVVSNTVTYTFVYPYYYGEGAAGFDGSDMASLTKYIIASTASVNRTFTPNGSEKMYFAYPAAYPALTSIKDENNFEVLPDWSVSTDNVTGLDGNPVSYRIYEFDNIAAAGSYSFTFVR